MPHKHTLVIGNSKYKFEEEFPIIEYAANDASKVFSVLTHDSTSVFQKETSQCKINLSRNEMDDALAEFFSNVDRSDMVLIYFAGHARVVSGKRLFLIMKDSVPDHLLAPLSILMLYYYT
jgi:hypothetical protein